MRIAQALQLGPGQMAGVVHATQHELGGRRGPGGAFAQQLAMRIQHRRRAYLPAVLAPSAPSHAASSRLAIELELAGDLRDALPGGPPLIGRVQANPFARADLHRRDVCSVYGIIL
jgi:hypothetical protein